ncbi:hypothetical protein C8R45DRAFT_1216624 [Mycena sanguinolenta]|nr:hypothetical protein C8R45DRAFT_1216624 [Mycena sanguinolenta]
MSSTSTLLSLCDECALVLGGPWILASKNALVNNSTYTDGSSNGGGIDIDVCPGSPLRDFSVKNVRLYSVALGLSLPQTTHSVFAISSTSTISGPGIAWRSPYLPAPTLAPHPQQWPVQYWSAAYQPYGQAPAHASASAFISAPAPLLFRPAPAPLRFVTAYAPAPAAAPFPARTPAPIPPSPERGEPPKRILLLPPTPASDDTPPPIAYLSLPLLLADLNRLLMTPHGGLGFEFRAVCTEIIGGRDVLRQDSLEKHAQAYGGKERLRRRVLEVAWKVLDCTVLAFNVPSLEFTDEKGQTVVAKVAKVGSTAMWMGDPRLVEANGRNSKETNRRKESEKDKGGDAHTQAQVQTTEELPCTHCEHLLTIGVALELRRNAVGETTAISLLHSAA